MRLRRCFLFWGYVEHRWIEKTIFRCDVNMEMDGEEKRKLHLDLDHAHCESLLFPKLYRFAQSHIHTGVRTHTQTHTMLLHLDERKFFHMTTPYLMKIFFFSAAFTARENFHALESGDN